MNEPNPLTVTPGRFALALSLVERATRMFENDAPDENWFGDYFRLTGQHGIETEDGWITGQEYEQIADEYKPTILDEVNPPNGIDRSFGAWREQMLEQAREQSEIEFEGNVYIIAQVFAQGLHLAREGEDVGVFTYEELKAVRAKLLK